MDVFHSLIIFFLSPMLVVFSELITGLAVNPFHDSIPDLQGQFNSPSACERAFRSGITKH